MQIFNSAATCARRFRSCAANSIRIGHLRRGLALAAAALLAGAYAAAQNPLETLRKAAEAQAAKAKQEAATKSLGAATRNRIAASSTSSTAPSRLPASNPT